MEILLEITVIGAVVLFLYKLGYEASLSFAASLSDSITASVSYLGAYRDNYREHTGMLNVKYAF